MALLKKPDYDAKICDIEAKYFNTSDCNKFTNEILNVKIKGKDLVDKSGISIFIDNSHLDKKIATFAANLKLKAEQEKIVKLQSFDFSF